MKNNKIIGLTILLIGIVMIGVIGMSKYVESSWQAIGNSENQLTVDENNLHVEESVYNYPYFNVKEHRLLTDEIALDRYNPAIQQYERDVQNDNYGTSFYIFDKDPLDDMISYQQVANIGGEVAKYLYGLTEHQDLPVMIQYIYDKNTDAIYNEYYNYNLITDSHDVITICVDPYTGKIFNISAGRFLVVKPDYDNIKADKTTNFLTEDVKIAITAQTKENLDIIGNYSETDKIEIADKHASDGYYNFFVHIWHKDGSESFMRYITTDFKYFELEGYDTLIE